MKPKKLSLLLTILPMTIIVAGCHFQRESKVDITPHRINFQADDLYRQAMVLMESSCDVDPTRGCTRSLDKALATDSLDPDYYGTKAKLLSEVGELDSVLYIQTLVIEESVITGKHLFQLGPLQTAKNMHIEVHESFGKSKVFLQAVLKQYFDSLGAFIPTEAASSLYESKDLLLMRNIDEIRKRFPEGLLEIEVTQRVKPYLLVSQIRRIKTEKDCNINFGMDSLVETTVNKD